ncbi:MAG: methylmalonyl-CoA mutase family protein, partial [Bdellovibrionota bacterium]
MNKNFKTSSEIELKPFYTSDDTKTLQEPPTPGKYPFTRGVYETMYRGRPWTMRQYAGFGSAKESNKRYHELLKKGQTGLSVAFDLPTQMGYDSDHIMSTGEVGKVGVAISSIEDMDLLLKDIPLDKVSTSMTINATASILLAFYIATARKRGIDMDKISGTIQNDILKEYIARGTYIYPAKPSLRIITNIFEYCAKNVPQWNTISISGYHIREAGSTAAQEVAFTIANGITYVEAAIKAGLSVDEFAPRLSFFFNVHNNFFEEIAKFRAARKMWAEIMKNRFGAKSEKSMMLRFHSQTAGSTLTAQQPENNIARVTLQAMASVLGGTQSLHTNSMDEALGLPTSKSATIALRTQQIIAYESGVTAVSDPLAGSHYVEALTAEVEQRATNYIQRIEDLGGVLKCIESGWIQREIQEAAYRFQKDFESKEAIVVGVNEFQIENEMPPEIMKIKSAVEKEQVSRLKAFKKKRKSLGVKTKLEQLANASNTNENLMPIIIDCVENKVTLGEISDTLRKS